MDTVAVWSELTSIVGLLSSYCCSYVLFFCYG